MSLSKYESKVQTLAISQEEAYARFSDLRNILALKERLADRGSVEAATGKSMSDEEWQKISAAIEKVEATETTLTIASPVGNLSLEIVEQEAPKLLKLAGQNTPLPIYLWLQLLPEGEAAAKLKVTVGAEVNMFMKPMVAKPLQQAADGLAQVLCLVRSSTFSSPC